LQDFKVNCVRHLPLIFSSTWSWKGIKEAEFSGGNMPVFALYPNRKSVLEIGSFGDVELDDQLARDLINNNTDEDVTFVNFDKIETAIAVCVWINCRKWIFK
jgi:hypothetical protein